MMLCMADVLSRPQAIAFQSAVLAHCGGAARWWLALPFRRARTTVTSGLTSQPNGTWPLIFLLIERVYP